LRKETKKVVEESVGDKKGDIVEPETTEEKPQ
jgi:hypothetical protein